VTIIRASMAKLGIPFQACTGPWGSRSVALLGFLDSRHMKVVRMSTPSTGRLYPQGI